MRQRILYFDVISLLLSEQYTKSTPHIKQLVDTATPFSSYFFEKIQLDQHAINLLNEFSRKTNVLLYPIQQRFEREFLITQGFDESVLAVDASYKVRYGDTNEINHKIAHAHAIDSDWFFVSDRYDKAFIETQFPERVIDAGVAGVTPDLIQNLMDKLDVTDQ